MAETDLIKKPINQQTGKEYESCTYALFPGCKLCAFEPELVVKLYDSIRFQHEDTGIMFMCCEDPTAIKTAWESLGKPQLICSCPSCMQAIKESLPEIPVVSLYRLLIDFGISGGCNSVDYCLWECDEDIRALAEDMGVNVQPVSQSNPFSAEYPFITSSISDRNMLKEHGCNAAHILELIYGMGTSNAHLVHEHNHDHEGCSGDHEGCGGSQGAPATADSSHGIGLPDSDQQLANRIELKEVMLSLFWNE